MLVWFVFCVGSFVFGFFLICMCIEGRGGMYSNTPEAVKKKKKEENRTCIIKQTRFLPSVN